MTDLTSTHIDKLAALVAAGDDGLCLSELGAGTALYFGLIGWATITNNKTAPQRAVATRSAVPALRAARQQEYAF